jgi:hypothetical protein
MGSCGTTLPQILHLTVVHFSKIVAPRCESFAPIGSVVRPSPSSPSTAFSALFVAPSNPVDRSATMTAVPGMVISATACFCSIQIMLSTCLDAKQVSNLIHSIRRYRHAEHFHIYFNPVIWCPRTIASSPLIPTPFGLPMAIVGAALAVALTSPVLALGSQARVFSIEACMITLVFAFEGMAAVVGCFRFDAHGESIEFLNWW